MDIIITEILLLQVVYIIQQILPIIQLVLKNYASDASIVSVSSCL